MRLRKILPMFEVTDLLKGGLNQMMFLVLWFGLHFAVVYSMGCLWPFIFSALLYTILFLLNMFMLEEFSDSLRLIDIGMCLMMEGGWLEEVFM